MVLMSGTFEELKDDCLINLTKKWTELHHVYLKKLLRNFENIVNTFSFANLKYSHQDFTS